MEHTAARSGLFVLSVLLGAPAGVVAQSTDVAADAILVEIVVTARKREESLQETPISITAFGAEALQERSVDDLRDVAQFTPNLVITPSAEIGAAGAQVFIRGIGQFEQIMTTDPGVGVYVDGVYLGRTPGAMLEMVDFERIEVLRGPQGTLFGKNTIGGAINAVSRRPGNEPEGRLGLTVGNFERREAALAFNLPLIEDRAAARFNLLARRHDGYGDVLDAGTGAVMGEAGAEDSIAGRLALRMDFSPTFTATLTLDGTRARDGQAAHHLEVVDDAHPFIQLHNALNPQDPIHSGLVLDDEYDTYGDGDFESDVDVWGTALIADWDLGPAADLKSVTSYRGMEVQTAVDGDGTPADYVQNYDETEQRQWSQEVQVLGTALHERLDWVGGILYFHEQADAHNVNFLLQDTPFGVGSANNRSSIDTDNWAVYGEGTFALTERLSLTTGARYTYEKKHFSFDFRGALVDVPTFPAGAVQDTWKAVTPRVSVDYRWTDSVLTYLSAARGFRSGGFNGRANTATGLQSFDPEYVLAYEVGVKTEFLDNRLRINGAAYFNDYTDLQFLVIRADPQAGFALFTENAAAAEVRGFEIEITALPINALMLNLGVGYIDSEITDVNDPTSGVPRGAKLQEAPDWTVNGGAQYEWSLGAGGTLRLRGDVVHQGETFHNGDNSPTLRENGYTVFNARLTYLHPSDRWELALWGRNLSDERYRVAGIDVLADVGLADAQYAAPREFGLSVNFNY